MSNTWAFFTSALTIRSFDQLSIYFKPTREVNLKLKSLANDQVAITKCVWMMLFYAEPSLHTMAKLETQLVKDSSHNLSWSAPNVYTNQPPKTCKIPKNVIVRHSS